MKSEEYIEYLQSDEYVNFVRRNDLKAEIGNIFAVIGIVIMGAGIGLSFLSGTIEWLLLLGWLLIFIIYPVTTWIGIPLTAIGVLASFLDFGATTGNVVILLGFIIVGGGFWAQFRYT
ncbi:MAG: hypothetical protein ACXQS7_04235 [Candidatus Syntropharchaeia archaeon]